MRNFIPGFVLGLALAAGCGTDTGGGPEILPNLTVPPKPTHGIQVITPIFEDIQPSMDYEVCTWTDAIFDTQTDIRSTLGYQTEPPGHHAIVFYTTEKQPPGTQRVCTDTDMASFRYLSGNGTNGEVNEAPGNLVYRIPAGAQLVINHHYLNSTDEVLRGQALVNLNYAPPGDYIPSGSTAFLDTQINVPQGVSSWDIHCTLDRKMKLWYLIPHMHRWGKEITVDITHAGEKMRQFDTIWDPSFTFHPPEKRIDPATPMTLDVGDKVDIRCTWDNDQTRDLTFGFEMCVSFGQFVDDAGQGSWACDGGNWSEF